MAERVTTKRTSRVTFLGVSNLPHEKAIRLRDILQNIVTHLSALHASCDDPKIQVDERSKKVADLNALNEELSELVDIAQLQVEVCTAENDIKQSVRGVADHLVADAHALRGQLASFRSGSPNAFHIVESLLSLVKLAVDLLRAADRYTIRRVSAMAEEVEKLADGVTLATNMAGLVERATPLSRAALELARIAEQRATALEQNNAAKEVKELLHNSSANIGTYTPQVILAVKQAITENRHADRNALHALKKALADIIHAAQKSPEFTVIFDVDYLDTELGLRLAALAEAVRNGDRIGTSTNAKAVDKELERRIALAKKDPAMEPTIRAVHAANQSAQAAAKEALNTRLSHPDPQSGSYLIADRQMTSQFNVLKELAAALPDASIARKNTQVPLIQAARALSLQLWGLLQQ